MWLDNADGALANESGNLRLVVRSVGGLTRFLVTKRGGLGDGDTRFLVGSGTSADTSSAMRAAEMMTARVRSMWSEEDARR